MAAHDPLQTLLDQIHALEETLADPARSRAHTEQQVARLRPTLAQLVQRRDTLLTSGHPQAVALVPPLQARIAALQEKITWLQQHAEPTAQPPAGTHAALRTALHQVVVWLRADPSVPTAHVQRYQRRVATLVRDRHQQLHAVSTRVHDAAQYTLQALKLLETARTELPARPKAREATDRLDMARTALHDAHRALRTLADQWPELAPLAARPDWHKVPLGTVRDLLFPPDADDELTLPDAAFAARLAEAAKTARGLALWVRELQQAVEDAPLPTG